MKAPNNIFGKLKTQNFPQESIQGIAESSALFVIRTDEELLFWDFAGEKVASRRTAKQLYILAVSPDKKYIVLAYYDEIMVLNGKSRRLIKKWPHQNRYNPPNSIHFSPDSKKIFVAYSYFVHVFDIATGQKEAEFKDHLEGIYSVDENYLIGKSFHHIREAYIKDTDDVIHVYDLRTKELLWTKRYGFLVAKISPDKKHLIAAYDRFFIWDIQTGKDIAIHLMPIIWHTNQFRQQSLIHEFIFLGNDSCIFRTAYNIGIFSFTNPEDYRILHTSASKIRYLQVLSPNLYLYVEETGMLRVHSLPRNDVIGYGGKIGSGILQAHYSPEKEILVLAERQALHFLEIKQETINGFQTYLEDFRVNTDEDRAAINSNMALLRRVKKEGRDDSRPKTKLE